ncbi:carboxypeptidase-like regulatory domain-containing protein [Halalkalibacter alkalisediminis]|uniref:Carboxypeptidase regulatory-like domain-containing protein n=1 Tax=Halalkalibacter alkalisediminis TaxID=935616 RepID=A0ABV6NJ38_9BACI|nr:carboxypeptidase-like regulatory domain-containing protein [Halalkalibacter alkalisediminis]
MVSLLRKSLFFALLITLLGSLSVSALAETNQNRNQDHYQAMKSEKEIKIHRFEAKVKLEGHELRNSSLFIQEKGKSAKSYQVLTDSTGKLKTKLPNGSYTIKAVIEDETWYSTNASFYVEDGKVEGAKENEINLTQKSKRKESKRKAQHNVQGSLTEGTKGLKGDLLIAKHTDVEYEEEIFVISSKNNGQFTAALSDGNYYMWGVLVNGGYYRYDLSFSVVGKDLYVNGEQESSLTVMLPENRYKGIVRDNSKPLSGADIILEEVIDEDDYYFEFIQAVTTNNKGEFQLRELPDGEYSLSIADKTYYAWDYQRFTVVDGNIFVDGKQVSVLDAKIPTISLKGTVYDGKNPLTYGYIDIEQLDEDGYTKDYFGAAVDQKGKFAYRLNDGNYRISYVDELNRYTRVDISFEVQNGKLIQDGKVITSLNIDLPSVTLLGKIVDGEDSLHGHVDIEKISEDSYEWHYATTDQNGIYSLRLPDGEYKVTWMYLYEEHEGIPLSKMFEIKDRQLYVDGKKLDILELQVPPVTLNGLLKEGDNTLDSGEIGVISIEEGFYYWKWINEDGTFTMRLPDGHYIVRDVYTGEGSNTYVNLTFEIRNGQLYVNDELAKRLEIEVPPVTLFGNLTDNGVPVQGDVSIHSITTDPDGEYYYFWGWTNEEGSFSFRLPDGDYQMNYVYLYDGTSFVSGKPFTIQSGQLLINGEAQELLEIQANPVTLSGKVYNKGKVIRDGYVAVVKVNDEGDWIDWQDGWIGYDGTYKFRLSDGEYELLYVDTFKETVSFYLPIIIHGGIAIVNGEEVSTLDLELQEGTIIP